MHKLTDKEITENLLRGNSCKNCLVSMSVQFMMKGEAERIMKKYRCEAKLIITKEARLDWLAPPESICKWYKENDF